MIMPLGPDIALALNIPMSHLGWSSGAYTLASALVGVTAAVYLDKFDRKKALLIAMTGLAICTALCGFAWDFASLVTIRFITGMFGGPCNALSYVIIADIIPEKRRGAALSKLVAAFSIGSLFGIPFGLELARLVNWRMPFFVTFVLALIVIVALKKYLPSLKDHVHASEKASFRKLRALLTHRLHLWSFFCVALGMVAAHMIIPNLSAYVLFNMDYPRKYLGLLYVGGGISTMGVVMVVGKLIDRTRPSIAGLLGAFFLMLCMYGGMLHHPGWFSPVVLYIIFTMGTLTRNITTQTLVAKIPTAHERAGFMSLISCVTNLSIAAGAFLASMMLTEAPDKSLIGMDNVVILAMMLTVLIPIVMWWIEVHLKKRDLAAHHPPLPLEMV